MKDKDSFTFRYPIKVNGIPKEDNLEISNNFDYCNAFKIKGDIYNYEHKLGCCFEFQFQFQFRIYQYSYYV